jgi:hypothetical protein
MRRLFAQFEVLAKPAEL